MFHQIKEVFKIKKICVPKFKGLIDETFVEIITTELQKPTLMNIKIPNLTNSRHISQWDQIKFRGPFGGSLAAVQITS